MIFFPNLAQNMNCGKTLELAEAVRLINFIRNDHSFIHLHIVRWMLAKFNSSNAVLLVCKQILTFS